MKIQLILVFTLLMLVACSKDGVEPGGNQSGTNDVAYLSIKIQKQGGTRAGSDEDKGLQAESTLKTFYLLTFDEDKKILRIPDEGLYYLEINNPATSPAPLKVSAFTKKVFAVANPGEALKTVIKGLGPTSSYSAFTRAIGTITTSEVIDPDITNITKGFTMISSGKEEDTMVSGDIIEDGLITVTVYRAEDFSTASDPEQAAKDAADASRIEIKIERLAARFNLEAPAATLNVEPAGATFELEGWTLDALNTQLYPFAEKTLLSAVNHTASLNAYIYNFYTKDPNFIPGTVGEGLDFVTVNTTTYEPELRLPFDDWLDDSDTGYTIENTMDAAEQKYGNATRIVIKGIYYPDAGWSGDWFSFAGVNYETFALLKAAYTAAGTGSDLIAACDDMFNKIKTYKPSITASDFSGLQAVDLTGISNGGEIIKTDKNTACIRWYQDGLNYYYYENRHDDDTLGEMAFGKYGVVRNNWYKLKITHVSGPGTPWYPDINEPGPGDPDPVDPIDPYSGYIGIEIDVQPWIVWERGIGI